MNEIKVVKKMRKNVMEEKESEITHKVGKRKWKILKTRKNRRRNSIEIRSNHILPYCRIIVYDTTVCHTVVYHTVMYHIVTSQITEYCVTVYHTLVYHITVY